jgi:bifunctional N-acetylglucosamine-1-phosphate-uridyltransferase/glucosamine-1-phosphate-acetyltransferase GlmU-like protein
VLALAVAEQHSIAHVTVADAQRVLGVNTHADLAYLETLLRQQQPG